MNARALTVLLASAFIFAGCASQTDSTSGSDAAAASSANAERLAEQQRKIAMLESELRNKERQVSTLSTDLESARSVSGTGSAMASGGVGSASGDLFPPNPRPGECYARVVIPAQTKTTTKRVLKKEASERIEIIPARFEMATERVLVKEASTKLEVVPPVYEVVEERVLVKPSETKIEVVPARYETVTERVMVKPASKQVVEVPAVYKTVTERVLDTPARTEWKRATGQGSGQGVASGGAAAQIQRFGDLKVVETRVEDTGEVMCLVEVPAKYKTIEKRVLVSPATTKTVDIPAEYETITKQMLAAPATTRESQVAGKERWETIKVNKLVRPASTRTVEIPAVYKDVPVRKMVSPPQEKRTPIPAEYETVTQTEKVSNERIEWRPVLCEVNMSAQNISALQSALSKTGCCRCGPNRDRQCTVDGIMGPCTLQAARCYARQKGLPSGDKYVTMEVIRSLGLKF